MPRMRATSGPAVPFFDLYDFLGKPALLAALSFIAYLLGALVTVPAEAFSRGPLGRLATFSGGLQSRTAEVEFQFFMQRLMAQAQRLVSRLENEDAEELGQFVRRSVRPGLDDLRARLLVANTALYGEYDRLAAEASFRLNISPPIAALIIGAMAKFGGGAGLVPVVVLGAVAVSALVAQGLRRTGLSRGVLLRAAATGVFELALSAEIRRLSV